MKLLSFVNNGRPSWGAAVGGGILDLGAFSGGQFPDLKSFIAAGLPQDLLAAAGAPEFGFDDVELAPVIPNPAKIVMAAVNYYDDMTDHSTLPAYPVLFLRLPSSQIAHGAPLIEPRSSQKLDFEGELAVIIGREGRHIPSEKAMSHVAGYSIYNDGSVRDWQKHSHQFTPGKNFTGTGSFGPWMVEAGDLPIPQVGVSLVTRVNGVEKQRTDTSRMIFDIPYLISYISTFAPLEAGDVIVTGTCTGFGATRRPPEFLTPGDVVDVEIEGIGVLSNAVQAEA
ncbi:fumarylacetoacetate hydrolase family protein [Roseicitreum antarcticum]|uniref:2-keto-4-pentenoate hydratase/2-oxohepta-3-ene-1,7-dioic acid hydratase (Catechol pathway) n=1 Tax=Roseicitreum antarcticum TaxID=564137 RepID=A0A1H2W4A4_9RHOB|nr:fumarylacetoacetate hydrolase family protein [Roseicitreum antarcticum]SDW74909.1 2-keto-4-pentenoate hydratase/2-oxohepta-3-ene-1,7-dioic acid hydratase (catechol pathway) [Roseicitreum antarcticum]